MAGWHKCVRDWLKRTDRDVASLAWSLAEERQRRKFGGLTAIHIKAHAGDRKQRSQFTHREVMNVQADKLKHAITPSMPMYASFRLPVMGETTLWYQPTEYETLVVERCTRSPEAYRTQHVCAPLIDSTTLHNSIMSCVPSSPVLGSWGGCESLVVV